MTTLNYSAIRNILEQVMAERRAQLERFGVEYHLKDGTSAELQQFLDPLRDLVDSKMEKAEHTWLEVAAEEFFEAATEADPRKLRAELVQLAAVTFAWIEALDCRDGFKAECILDVVKYGVQKGWPEQQVIAECGRRWPSMRDLPSIGEAFREMQTQHAQQVAKS